MAEDNSKGIIPNGVKQKDKRAQDTSNRKNVRGSVEGAGGLIPIRKGNGSNPKK